VSLLDQVKAAVQQVQGNEELNALRFRHEAIWSDGTSARFSVQDPTKGKDVRAASTDPEAASLRVLRIHPADTSPAVGSHTLWETGTLYLGPRADASDFTGQATTACRMVDARYYPQVATTSSGTTLILRIEAASGRAVTAGAGQADVQALSLASHKGFIPPGIVLNQGEGLTLSTGEQFRVLDPIERAVLGDTVGLSREGTGVW